MKKGFTLIELLAVIVILAIIALIASPIVIGLIENANKESAERSTEAAANAAKTAYALKQLDPTKTLPTNVCGLTMDNAPASTVCAVTATPGTVAFGTDGAVTITNANFNGYKCSYGATGASCTKI